MCRAIVEAFALDIAKRTLNEPHAPDGERLIGHDIEPGRVFHDDRVKVEAFDVPHGEWATVHGPHPTLGYRVTAEDRTIIISGDTSWHSEMPALYADVDVLVHEVFASSGLSSRPAEWQEYHHASHTSATELGAVSSQAQPGLVALTHQLLWDASAEDVLDEIGTVYDGPFEYGTDLLVV
jgi:ribonuclease Z